MIQTFSLLYNISPMESAIYSYGLVKVITCGFHHSKLKVIVLINLLKLSGFADGVQPMVQAV